MNKAQRLLRPNNQNMSPAQNPYFNNAAQYQGNHDAFRGNQLQWNGQQQIPNCQHPNTAMNHFPFFGENNQYFDENFQSANNKRPREYYDGDDAQNPAKRQNTTGPSIQYAMKKSTDPAYSMKKALDLLFESEITADGWEKIDNRILYHVMIRGITYYHWGISVDLARESAAEIALNNLVDLKIQPISWSNQLLPFQLEQPFADAIELLVKNKFNVLMKNDGQSKAPKVLSGIVMTNGTSSLDGALVVAIGTGTKCCADKMKDQNGKVLHDMHAEVLVRRSFLRFLYLQLEAMSEEKDSIFILNGKEIQLKADVKFHLYVNMVPCGDARVFSKKGCAKLKKKAIQGELRTKRIGGTDNISETTIDRTKSMSCSDKIARWNVLGLQGAALSKYIKPIYLDSIVLGSHYVPFHMHRAMFGRLENTAVEQLNAADGYRLNKPKFESTFVMEIVNFALCEDQGVCWNVGENPQFIDLNTGLKTNGKASHVSKTSLQFMFNKIAEQLADCAVEGTDKYNEVKRMFYDALKAKNLGTWDNKMN